jgi:hypothetical protein
MIRGRAKDMPRNSGRSGAVLELAFAGLVIARASIKAWLALLAGVSRPGLLLVDAKNLVYH